MTESKSPSAYTIAGLLVAFFVVPLVVNLFSYAAPSGPLNNLFVVERELSVFLVTGVLLWIVVKGEKLGLSSIGLNWTHWRKSLLWSLVLAILSLAAVLGCLAVFQLVGISFGSGEGDRYQNVSLWVITLMVVRAGIVEEICYRGYIIERLEKISSQWIVTLLLPSLLFGLLHYRQGIGGIIIAFVAGMVLAISYWKRRDLKANIIAHFLVDFIPNVVAQWF